MNNEEKVKEAARTLRDTALTAFDVPLKVLASATWVMRNPDKAAEVLEEESDRIEEMVSDEASDEEVRRAVEQIENERDDI